MKKLYIVITISIFCLLNSFSVSSIYAANPCCKTTSSTGEGGTCSVTGGRQYVNGVLVQCCGDNWASIGCASQTCQTVDPVCGGGWSSSCSSGDCASATLGCSDCNVNTTTCYRPKTCVGDYGGQCWTAAGSSCATFNDTYSCCLYVAKGPGDCTGACCCKLDCPSGKVKSSSCGAGYHCESSETVSGCGTTSQCCKCVQNTNGACSSTVSVADGPTNGSTSSTFCATGTVANVSANTTEGDGTGWKYDCNGNGGTNASCFVQKSCSDGYHPVGTTCVRNTYTFYYCKTSDYTCSSTSSTYVDASACQTALSANLSGQTTGTCYSTFDGCTAACVMPDCDCGTRSDYCSDYDATGTNCATQHCTATGASCTSCNTCSSTTHKCVVDDTKDVDGGWSTCTLATGNCGAGTRTCTNPAPVCGGDTCTGLASCSINCSGSQICCSNNCSDATCSANSDCDDNNLCTTDTCQNADTCNASCSNTSTALYAYCTGSSCPLACGQSDGAYCTGGNSCGSTTCSGTCASDCPMTDTGLPTKPTLLSPIGTEINPVPYDSVADVVLSWNSYVDSKADSLSVGIWDANGVGAIKDGINTSSTSVNANTFLPIMSHGTVYHWQANALNSTCKNTGVSQDYWSDWTVPGYFMINSAPTLDNLKIKNSNNQVVVAETGDRNHICQTEFSSDRIIRFVVTASDPDGVDDITIIRLRLGGVVYDPSSLVNGVATFDVQFQEDDPTNTFNVEIYVEDAYGLNNGWVNSVVTRNIKIWDCKVGISGILYDGSSAILGVINCDNDSDDFSTPVTVGYSLSFNNVDMTVDTPNYNSNGNYLTWGLSYTPIFTLSGAEPRMRVQGTCQNNLVLNNSLVDPYGNNMNLIVDFSSILNQEAWFQTYGGGINAKTEILNRVPVTCAIDSTSNCQPYFSVQSLTALGVGNSDSGLIAAPNINNDSGCGDQCGEGFPNNWSLNSNVISENYSYKYFYDRYHVNLGLGKVVDGSANLSTATEGIGDYEVVFVNGDLTVDQDNIVPVGKFLMLVVSGDINVGNNVNTLEGIFVANGSINVGGNSNNDLKINGIIYSVNSNVNITRSFETQSKNNTEPALEVHYRPDLMFNMPAKLVRLVSGWSVN